MAEQISKKAAEGADILISRCGSVRAGERVLIVCDASTRAVGDLLFQRARALTDKSELLVVKEFAMHGEEPPADAAAAMQAADLCLGVTAKSMAHTAARRALSQAGGRYLSLPDYSLELLEDGSLRADFKSRKTATMAVADAFTQGRRITVSTQAGTDIVLDAGGRTGNCCPGFVSAPGELGSPPDIEANVSPVETASEGVVVVDGSIPFPTLGTLKSPVRLTVRQGKIVKMEGAPEVLAELERLFKTAGSDKALVLAECGVGLNEKAKLTGTMLTDEGAYGTMHFGFGSNATVGGVNDVAFHLDFVFRSPTLTVDGKTVLERGELRI